MKETHHGGMVDNKMVGGDHQKGIERVIQRKGEPGRVGQGGKMEMKPREKANWRRANSAMTPRKA